MLHHSTSLRPDKLSSPTTLLCDKPSSPTTCLADDSYPTIPTTTCLLFFFFFFGIGFYCHQPLATRHVHYRTLWVPNIEFQNDRMGSRLSRSTFRIPHLRPSVVSRGGRLSRAMGGTKSTLPAISYHVPWPYSGTWGRR